MNFLFNNSEEKKEMKKPHKRLRCQKHWSVTSLLLPTIFSLQNNLNPAVIFQYKPHLFPSMLHLKSCLNFIFFSQFVSDSWWRLQLSNLKSVFHEDHFKIQFCLVSQLLTFLIPGYSIASTYQNYLLAPLSL